MHHENLPSVDLQSSQLRWLGGKMSVWSSADLCSLIFNVIREYLGACLHSAVQTCYYNTTYYDNKSQTSASFPFPEPLLMPLRTVLIG